MKTIKINGIEMQVFKPAENSPHKLKYGGCLNCSWPDLSDAEQKEAMAEVERVITEIENDDQKGRVHLQEKEPKT